MSADGTLIQATGETVADAGVTRQDFDILDMPIEGLAAYWLSVKKLFDMKKSRKFIDDEAQYTEEPFVRHLLEIAFEPVPDAVFQASARAKLAAVHTGYRRKFAVMRDALAAMSVGENPRLTLIRMLSRYPVPPIAEPKALELAQTILRSMDDPNLDPRTLFGVDHKLKADRLAVKLLFYCLWSRREGTASCQQFLRHIRSRFFAEGLGLVVDGFETAFVTAQVDTLAREILIDTRRKMQMAAAMCEAIRAKLTYEQVYAVGRGYME